MNYTDYMNRVDSLSIGLDQSQFPITFPAMVDAAEQRIYRELDLLAAEVTDGSGSLTPNVGTFNITATTPFIILMKVSLLANGIRSQIEPVSRDLLDGVYGTSQTVGWPRWFAMVDPTTIALGPYPDQAYGIELVGKVRPAPLYTLGPTGTSFLSVYLPDLFIAASLAFVDTMKGVAEGQWEGQYQALKASAAVEEARRAFSGPGWTSLSEPAAATPSR